MATPSKAELWTQISNFIKIVDQYWQFAATNSPNYVGLEDTFVQSVEGNNVGDYLQYLRGFRQELNSRYSSARQILSVLLIELAKFGYAINTNGKTDSEIYDELSDAMHDASETIKNRAYAYGSISAGGSNVGTATVLRNVKDRNDYNLEISVPGVQRIEVYQDKNQGAAQGSEVVKFFGQGNQRIDKIQYGTSTDEFKNNIILANSSSSLLLDGSFDTLESGAALTKNEQANWTLSDYTKFERDATTFFRFKSGQGAQLNGIGVSLVAKSNTDDVWFAQYVGRAKFSLNKKAPYFLVLRVMVDNASTDGTLTLRLGSQTTTLDVSTLSANTWANVIIGTDKKGYFENFKENWISAANQDLGIRVRVDVASRTVAGKIYFDEIVLAQAVKFNGAWYLPIAGQNSGGNADALNGDYWTFTDSVTNTGRNQYTIAELLGVSLPHTSGTPTYADA